MPIWPESLPQCFDVQGLSRSAADNTKRTSVDQGPAFQAPKYSVSSEPVSGTMLMTRTQLRTFMTFYNDELAFGAIPFDWVDPLFEEPAEVQFDTSSRYQITPLSNKYFRVSMAIEINP